MGRGFYRVEFRRVDGRGGDWVESTGPDGRNLVISLI